MRDTVKAFICRLCRARGGPSNVVLDLGDQPSSKFFPRPSDPTPDARHPLAMWCCPDCGLAQLVADTTEEAEAPSVEPQALRDQAEQAVADCAQVGLLPGSGRVREFPSPHGGSWLPLLSERGLEPAQSGIDPVDVLVDSFGIMHAPDQRAAFAERAGSLTAGGVWLLQVHSLASILAQREWNALRHGHFAYYSVTALVAALPEFGLTAVRAFEYPLYGGTVLVAVRRAQDRSGVGADLDSVRRLLRAERLAGVRDPRVLGALQRAVTENVDGLRDYLRTARDEGRRVLGYGAASRAVAQLVLAGIDATLLPAVADASPGKQGRCLPVSRVPIISPDELVDAEPDEVLLLLPDLAAELVDDHPQLCGRIVPVRQGRIGGPSPVVRHLHRSQQLQATLHQLVPGGAHTYARGPDQYPEFAAPVLVRGRGALAWDVDSNCYVEYGIGLRAVTLGHAHRRVDTAVAKALRDGVNFSRPTQLEALAAEDFLTEVPGAERIKFAKNGSDATTAAVKLARAATGRTRIAICRQAFFSADDWWISQTDMDAGIPAETRGQGVLFDFNDLDQVTDLAERSGEELAAIVLQPATAETEPDPGYLAGLRRLCDRRGIVLVFDEIITGFRWHRGGVQTRDGITPDLACWGKGIANGYALSALTGKAALMDLGGLGTDAARTFLMSTTYGPETVGLAALRAVLDEHRQGDPIEELRQAGVALADGVNQRCQDAGIGQFLGAHGNPRSLMFHTRDSSGHSSQAMRTIFMESLIAHGVLAQTFVPTTAHGPREIEHTLLAVEAAIATYRRALEVGPRNVLHGRPVAPALRRYASPRRLT